MGRPKVLGKLPDSELETDWRVVEYENHPYLVWFSHDCWELPRVWHIPKLVYRRKWLYYKEDRLGYPSSPYHWLNWPSGKMVYIACHKDPLVSALYCRDCVKYGDYQQFRVAFSHIVYLCIVDLLRQREEQATCPSK